MPFLRRAAFTWQLRTRSLQLGPRTLVMGVLNVTPDSFSDGNRFLEPHAAVDHALALLDAGADLLDVGGESTRPNATPVDPAQERTRIAPVLRAVCRARPGAVISVDTYHAETAEAALAEGVEIVNDVSGLLWDTRMAALLARERTGAVLMHTRGAPRMWSGLPALPVAEVTPLVVSGLTHTLELARVAGMERKHIVVDPGFGFGKRGAAENFALLASLHDLRRFNLPILVGLSRKRFLAEALPAGAAASPSDELREYASAAAGTAAILAGAHILRVHDVVRARAAAAVADAVLLAADEHGCGASVSPAP